MDTALTRFDPIEASKNLKAGFIDYITTTFHISDPVYKMAFSRELAKEGFLTKGPFLDMNGSYCTGQSLHTLMDNGLASRGFENLEPIEEKERELKIERPLYLHQEKALLKADAGNNLIVTTGTGSGKTECFLLPILQALLSEEQAGTLTDAVRAILIYPMNALANDQMKRMRKILKNHPKITFGIYTGNTRQKETEAKKAFHESYGKDEEILDNEMLSRERMRETPPHILMTNYSMLEYMMLRPKDDRVFSGAKLRYIVLDEAHIYKGTTGMETAMLMRRLRARISTRDSVQYILTSATLGDESANREITEFGRQLCGVPFLEENIIRSADATPKMNAMKAYPQELFHLLSDTANNVTDVLKKFDIEDPAPNGDDGEKLYELMLTSQLFARLRQESSATMEINALSKAMDISKQTLLDLVAVCTRAEKGKTALLKARIHYFVRALEGAYVTLGNDPQLLLTRQQTKADKQVFEIAICQDCGRIALVGHIDMDGRLMQVARKTDRDPKECDYYLLWNDQEEHIVFDNDDEENADGEIEETDEADYVVCPTCGTVGGKGDLRFGNICNCEHPAYVPVRQVNRTKAGRAAKCPACGHGEFRAFYLGNEAATSVLGTELFEQLPDREIKAKPKQDATTKTSRFSFGKEKPAATTIEKIPQFLCFSDSRSEAAYFAVYMENAYKRFLRNRGMWRAAKELVAEGTYCISVSAFVQKLIRIFEAERTFDHWDAKHDHLDSDSLRAASVDNAWIAVVSELFSARHSTSLSAVGMLHFEYASKNYSDIKEQIIGCLQETGLSEPDAADLMQQIFLDGVYTGALNAGSRHIFNDEERETIFFAKTQRMLVKVKGTNSPSYSSGWSARKRENGNYYPNTRNRRIAAATGWDEETANEFLYEVWDSVLAPSGEEFAFDICDFRILFHNDSKIKTWRCLKCGHVTAFNVQNRCPVLQCGGELAEVSFAELQSGNHYVNRYRGEKMKPLQMREHTAQLSRDSQTRYQQAFVDGKLNALSCSTTFEMGVDVGGLETVYMRDIPPGPANYVQRAGRAGRAAHTAAYVLTYAKLSSHDFTFYNDPSTVISGKIKAPAFTLENEKVLYRHIFAVALAEFLAANEDVYDGDNRNCLVNGDGYDRLAAFLEHPNERLTDLLQRSVPRAMHTRMGIANGSWREHLVGENGVLTNAVMSYRKELEQLLAEYKRAEREKNHGEAARLGREIGKFRAAPEDNAQRKSLIEFLTRNNVLPKYGFPVDTVELQIGARQGDSGLQLSRDLQMAIADYAPGSQIIADGKMYTSRYIRRAEVRGKNDDGWEYGFFARCMNPNCGEMNFSTKTSVRNTGADCISCGQKIGKSQWHRTLEPRLGFITADANGEPVPMRRPERDYKTDDYYVGSGSKTVLLTKEFAIGSEKVRLQSSKNDSLAVVGLGEHVVCPFCGFTTDAGDLVLKDNHKNARGYPCTYRSDGKDKPPIRLSHVFKTDVASVAFLTPDATDYNTMVSVLYALLEGLSRELDIERTDIKGCLHKIKWEGCSQPIYSIILYDAVAGGAGHVRRIVTEDGEVFSQVLERAYHVVNDCKCDPSCYSCIRNYYNQKIHDDLDRVKAANFLRVWRGTCSPIEAEDQEDGQKDIHISGGELAENYRTWSELIENNGFEANGHLFEQYGIPKVSCLIMPDVKIGEQPIEPYLVWENEKVMLFDEIEDTQKAALVESGWQVDTVDVSVAILSEILKGNN